MIIDEGNGWRDLTDEGPGMNINSEKEGYSVLQSDRLNAVISVNKNGKTIATVNNKTAGKHYVDMLLKEEKDQTKYSKKEGYVLESDIIGMAIELTTRSDDRYKAFGHAVLSYHYNKGN